MRIFLPILLFLASGLIFLFAVDPFYAEVKKLRSDIATYNEAVNNSTELQAMRDSLVEKYRNITEEDKNRLVNFLPNTVNNIKFILQIEQIANLNSMPLKNIKFEDKKPSAKSVVGSKTTLTDPLESLPYGIFTVEFVTEGTYDSFQLFLKDLEKNLRIIDIKSISFVSSLISDKPSGNKDSNVYSYTLKVETYWLK